MRLGEIWLFNESASKGLSYIMNNINVTTDRHRIPRNCRYVGVCFGPILNRGSPLRLLFPAGNCCPNYRQEIGRDDRRPLTLATGYLDGVLICNGCNRSTSHGYDGYGAFIRGMFVRYIWYDFHRSLIKISSNLPQLLGFYFSQSGLKIEFCRNIWISAPLFWLLTTVGNTCSWQTRRRGRAPLEVVWLSSWVLEWYRKSMRGLRQNILVHFVVVKIDSGEIMGSHRWVGGSYTDSFNCDGSAHELSVAPASDGSRSNWPIEGSTKWKLRALQMMNGIWYRIFTWGKEWVAWRACNITPDWTLATLNFQMVRTGSPWVTRLILISLWTGRGCVQAVHDSEVLSQHWRPHFDRSLR